VKDENYWKILNSAVRLDVQKGHLRWTVAELARASGVGRTLIYYYFGKSKEQVIKTALNIIAEEVFGLSPERLQLWQEGRIAESIEKSRDMLKLAPQLREFYFHWRYTPSETQEDLVRVEKRYLQKLKKAKPSLSNVAAEAVFALLFGLVMHPSASPAAIQMAVKTLDKILS
jgi:AcrR family transcriptional regulator